jgi:hypothetical protein
MLRALVLSLLTFVGLVTSLVARSLGADIDNRGRFEARTFAAG